MGEWVVTVINIATDFARYPFGRYVGDGPYSGQRFREELLVPALRRDSEEIVVNLDGAIGMGSSFLEEAFGGLVRQGFDRDEVARRVRISSSRDGTKAAEIGRYIAEAELPRRRAHA
jgi:hypothetical protein